MKKFSIILLKILGAVLVLTGIGVIVSMIPLTSIISNMIAKAEILRAALSSVILVFIWVIGTFMSLVGIRLLNKDSNDIVGR
jgi:hypothetical protein